MCLYIQNQSFERYTENMLNRLAEGAGACHPGGPSSAQPAQACPTCRPGRPLFANAANLHHPCPHCTLAGFAKQQLADAAKASAALREKTTELGSKAEAALGMLRRHQELEEARPREGAAWEGSTRGAAAAARWSVPGCRQRRTHQ